MKKPVFIFRNFLQINNIVCGIKETDGKLVLRQLISTLQQHTPGLDGEHVRMEVESREALFPTMIAPGFALPHARIQGLAQPLTAIGCIPDGCDFNGKTKAKVMVLMLTPVDNPNLHVQLLSALASIRTREVVFKPEDCTENAKQYSRENMLEAYRSLYKEVMEI